MLVNEAYVARSELAYTMINVKPTCQYLNFNNVRLAIAKCIPRKIKL